ncbi:hypothetical protein OPV22_009847 [Ensete ventricosum]|uniref:Uncharacterized protein n=1 Tax=Ensete ventricosum TaxID=4639 RepID=A0AAV8Q0T3_ENSVE|nr:hypothetical protein OPV22_009847 [Ensete ventricosum]
MSFSSINRQHSDSRPNGLNSSYPLVAGGDGTSLIHKTHDNGWKLGASSHVNLNGRMRPLRFNIGNSQEVEIEMCSFSSSMKSNTSSLVWETNQQITIRHQVVFEKDFSHDARADSQGYNMGKSKFDNYDVLNNHMDVAEGFGLWLNQPSQKQPLLNSELGLSLVNHLK